MRRMLNVRDRNAECNAHCCTSHPQICSLTGVSPLHSVCVKCHIVSYVHYEGGGRL